MNLRLLPDVIAPVTLIDREDPLLRYAHCDGSARNGSQLPLDLERAPNGAVFRGVALPPDAVLCLESAWELHTGAPADQVAVAVGRTRRPVSGARSHRMQLAPHEVVRRSGLRCTSMARTAFDLARMAEIGAAAQALTDIRGTPCGAEVAALLRTRAGWPGVARARALIELVW